MLPPKARRGTLVHYDVGEQTCAMCIYIGSNISRKDMKMAQNIDLISKVWDVLQLDAEPQWLRRDSQT